jgi:sugar phosphate permease
MRLLVYVVPASVYFFSYVHRVAPGAVAADLMRAFAIPAAALGSLSAIYPYTFVVMALIGGSFVDTLGPRWTLAAGGLTMALGAIVFGTAPVFAVAFVGRLLVGLGASVLLISWLTLLAAWFRPDRFAIISGSTQVVGSVAALMAATPLALVVEALGWRQTFITIGVVSAALAVVVALVVRDHPGAAGLAAVNPRPPHAPSLGEVLRGIPLVLGNRRTWPPALATGGIYASQIALLGLWGVPYLMQVYGFERVRAANTVSFVAIGMIVGAPLIGFISDRWLQRRRLPFVTAAIFYVACWVPLALGVRLVPENVAALFFVIGLSGSALVLVWACVREVNDPARVGVIMGFINMPIFLGFAVMQWAMGVILDAHWDGVVAQGVRLYPPSAYQAAFKLCLAVSAAAMITAFFITETRCRNIWSRATP